MEQVDVLKRCRRSALAADLIAVALVAHGKDGMGIFFFPFWDLGIGTRPEGVHGDGPYEKIDFAH